MVGPTLQLSSCTITPADGGYAYLSCACQQTLPLHTMAADAPTLVIASRPAPRVAPSMIRPSMIRPSVISASPFSQFQNTRDNVHTPRAVPATATLAPSSAIRGVPSLVKNAKKPRLATGASRSHKPLVLQTTSLTNHLDGATRGLGRDASAVLLTTLFGSVGFIRQPCATAGCDDR